MSLDSPVAELAFNGNKTKVNIFQRTLLCATPKSAIAPLHPPNELASLLSGNTIIRPGMIRPM